MTVILGTATDRDRAEMRAAIALSAKAAASGDLPFGARVVLPDGTVLAEAISTEISDADWTCHAETNAVRSVAALSPEVLRPATLYASAEPCAMCAAGAFYAGIRRIVFGISQPRLATFLTTVPETAGLNWRAEEVLALAHIPDGAIELIGPVEQAAAEAPHAAFWPTFSS